MNALDPFNRNVKPFVPDGDDKEGKQPDTQYVVAQGENGPYLDEHGRAQDDISKAKTHPSQAMAGIFADQATRERDPRGTRWTVIPAPTDGQDTDPDHDPSDSYRGLPMYRRAA